MKKYLITVFLLVVGLFLFDLLYYYSGILYLPNTDPVEYPAAVQGEQLYLNEQGGLQQFEIRGVNLGLSKPGYYAAEFGISEEEYLRWFEQIKAMGANTIRTQAITAPAFYNALYDFNLDNPDPLYLVHGVWVDDYLANASYSALDEEFYEPFADTCRDTVDVIHGRHKAHREESFLPYVYKKDISPWVIGYILGVEWEGTLVSYTDGSFARQPQLEGTYFRTEDASNFEIVLARIAEEMVTYETGKYASQRMISFANGATTDPLEHSEEIKKIFSKGGAVDVEHIRSAQEFAPGLFASYRVYPYHPDYCSHMDDPEENTYLQYLTLLNEHHAMPVVIIDFGASSARGMSAYEAGQGRNQGGISEQQQGEAIVSMYEDIVTSGCAGALVAAWQDEWFKRTWNTMAGMDLDRTPYWSDYQTSEQYFGLLSFDPGKEHSLCYVDGDPSDWSAEDVVLEQDGLRLSMKTDERFIYFLAEQEGFDVDTHTLYIPVDTTPKSGSTRAENLGLEMSHPADFVVEISGRDNSRVWVQERYDMVDALFYQSVTSDNIFSRDFPAPDSPQFVPVRMLLQETVYFRKADPTLGEVEDVPIAYYEYEDFNRQHYALQETYETGKLTYGNANPASADFNSLADFCAGDGFVELKLPWGLLNFANPSDMRIHDDYYDCYGVEYITIGSLQVGLGTGAEPIEMGSFRLKRLGRDPQTHERLKASYYILQQEWTAP